MIDLFESKKDLFEFKYGDITWLFTSASRPVTHNSKTYLPFVVSRGNIEVEDIDKCETEVVFPYPQVIANENGDDIQKLFANKIYFGGVTLTIFELYKNETLVIYKGRVTQPKFDDDANTMTLVCSTSETYQNRNILTRKFQKSCANKIYDRFCGLIFDEWAITATVTAINGLVITFATSIPKPDGYFNRGLLFKNGVYTSILGSTSNSVSLYRQHFGLHVGDVVKIAPGCDQTRQVCHDKFNNHLRFMGFPNVPNSNPVNDQIIK
ncbi:phage BR0599 family protein [uncultured Acinetobacter sp.]|uniref:phage BR0599 family protein n=1 Tax=uncultured Acinetobacter sp. TaxID=165433 RepID=UPI00258296E2|nr:phage BR0599 family protein [uncultured Acinetobacter sp.]